MSNRPDDGSRFLRARREALGLTAAALAHVCGISPAYLSNIEAGRRRPPAELARTLAYHLQISPTELELEPAAAPERAAAA